MFSGCVGQEGFNPAVSDSGSQVNVFWLESEFLSLDLAPPSLLAETLSCAPA